MNFGQRPSLDEVQAFMEQQRAVLASAMEARRNLRHALAYACEHFERQEAEAVRSSHPMLCCDDLIEDGQWLSNLCCQKCHALAEREGPMHALIHDEYRRRPTLLCCRASLMLERGLPRHDIEYPD